MKKIITCLMTIVMLVFGTAIVGAAPKSDSQSTIGIVDVVRIMSESPKVKALQAQLDQTGKELSKQLDAEKANLSPEEFKKKQDAAVQEFQRRKTELESQVDLSIKQAMEKVAKEKKISLILYKNGVAYGGTDITNEVIISMQ
jgi:outer membrane protein